MNAEIKLITPAIATGLLKLNTNNRPLDERTIAVYADDMKNGRWRENGESIIITDLPRLGSGQHRLFATIRSGFSWKAVVVREVPDSSFPTLDTGKKRSAGNVLSCAGHKNAVALAATLTAIEAFAEAKIYLFTGKRSTSRIDELIGQYPDADVAIDLAKPIQSALNGSLALMAGALYWGLKIDEPLTVQFATQLASGAGLYAGCPALALRNAILKPRDSSFARGHTAALIAKALTAHLSGKEFKVIRIGESEEFPRITRQA
jgi:hypothetical protein